MLHAQALLSVLVISGLQSKGVMIIAKYETSNMTVVEIPLS